MMTILPPLAELGNVFSICPKLLINAELDGLVLAPRLGIWEANLQPLGANFSAFMTILTSMF
jgi:hypothetical protein